MGCSDMDLITNYYIKNLLLYMTKRYVFQRFLTKIYVACHLKLISIRQIIYVRVKVSCVRAILY